MLFTFLQKYINTSNDIYKETTTKRILTREFYMDLQPYKKQTIRHTTFLIHDSYCIKHTCTFIIKYIFSKSQK